MTDVARLGLEVRSEQVAKGSSELDKLTNAAKRAQAAAGGVSASTKNAGQAAVSLSASAGRAAASLNNEAAAAQKAAAALRTHSAAVNDNVVRVNRMGGSMSGLAAQFQDIGVTAAMGMNPVMIALQQGTQIAGQMEAAVQGGSSALSVLGQSFKSLFSPLTFVSIAMTALAAAALQMVDWTSVAQVSLGAVADVLELIAPYATVAAAGLALLYAPAIIGGLTVLSETILALTARLVGLGIGFAMANPGTAFVIGITAAVAAASIFRDELTKIFGVDLIGVAKRAANFVINSFFAAFEDLKFVWNNFGDIMGAAVIGGVNIAIRAIDALLTKAADGINWLIRQANKIPKVDIGEIDTSSGIIGGIENPYSGRLGKANAAHAANIQQIMSRDTIGDFGTAIANGASAASAKLRELAGSLGETEKAKKRAKTEAEKLAEKYNDILLDAEGFIAAQMAERDALLLTEEAASALRYEQELLNKAMQAGITIDAAKAAEIKSYAAAMAGAEAETSRFREALNFAKDLTKGFVSDLRSGLEQGKGFWRSFGDAAMNVLDKIVDKLLNNVIDALFQVNSVGSRGGGGGGFLSGILGGIGRLFGFASGGYTGAGAASQPAGIVHAGEYVMSKSAVDRLGVGYLDALHNAAKGYQMGGYVRSHAPANINMRGYQAGGYVQSAQRGINVSIQNYGTSKDFEVQQIGPDEVRIIARDEVANYDKGRKARLVADLPDLRRRGVA